MTEPKSEMGPKSILDPEEPGNKIEHRKLFFDGIRTGPTTKICTVLQDRPKRVSGPDFKIQKNGP